VPRFGGPYTNCTMLVTKIRTWATKEVFGTASLLFLQLRSSSALPNILSSKKSAPKKKVELELTPRFFWSTSRGPLVFRVLYSHMELRGNYPLWHWLTTYYFSCSTPCLPVRCFPPYATSLFRCSSSYARMMPCSI
jgi:hypothetical protein